MKKFKTKMKKVSRIMLVALLTFTSLSFTNTSKEVNAATSLVEETTLEINRIASNVTIEGLRENSNMSEMKLGGSYAFCMDNGLYASSSYTYTYGGIITDTSIIKIMNWYDSVKHIGDSAYFLAQLLIWCVQEGITDTTKMREMWYASVCPILWPTQDESYNIQIYQYLIANFNDASSAGTYHYWNTGNSSHQRIVVLDDPETYIPRIETASVSATESYESSESIAVEITKTDENTGNPLSGVEFEIYKDGKLGATVTTNSKGYAEHTFATDFSASETVTIDYVTNYSSLSLANQAIVSSQYDHFSKSSAQSAATSKALELAKEAALDGSGESHTYEVVEVSTRTGYVLNKETNTYTKTGSGTITANITNKVQTGSVSVTKTDKETSDTLSNAIFTIYAKEDIIHPDGITGIIYNKGDVVKVMDATNSLGVTSVSGLYLGKYYIVETQAPNGYVLEDTQYDFELTYAGQNVEFASSQSVSSTNTTQRVEISIDKYDYGMYHYESSEGASNNEDIVDFNNNGAQGDATLEGAVYGLYAKNTINHPSGSGTVTYNALKDSVNEITLLEGSDLVVYEVSASKDTLLATAKTNEYGEITFGHLFNGEYYVKEITAPEGYLLDSSTYQLDGSYTDPTAYTISTQTNVYDTVIKQAFEISKYGMSSGSGALLTPLEGVTFEVQLESDIQSFINEGYTLEQAKELAPVYDTLVTDALGLDTSIELPYGTYRVTETITIGEYYFAEDFFIEINKDSREPLQHELFGTVINHEFEAMIKVVKQDVDTGKQVLIEGAEYRILNVETNEYIGYWDWFPFPTYVSTFTTNSEGYLIVGELFEAGTYRLEEVNAPDGYTLDDTAIEFVVSKNGMVSVGDDGKTPIITVIQKNNAVQGQIEVYKEGEVLVSYENGNFQYEVQPLQDAQYEIYAREAILDPSNDGTVLYEKDELIETLITGKDGKATSSKLYLGAYYVVESSAPEGYVVSDEQKEVSLEYADQYTAVVFEGVSFTNQRQKVDMSIFKKDEDTKVLLSGAEITLYANKDIVNYFGDVIVEAGTKLQTVISDENGNVSFDLDLPIDLSEENDLSDNETTDENGFTLVGNQDAMFKLMETKAPTGYQPKDIIYFVETRSIDQITIEYEPTTTFENEITKTYFDKVDTNSNNLVGSILQVIELVEKEYSLLEQVTNLISGDNDTVEYVEKVVTEWISDGTTHLVEGLEIGNTYYLREIDATTGYTIALDIEFTVEAYQTKTITMTNSQVEVAKYDDTTGELLAGASFEVFEVVDGKEVIIDEFTTTDTTYFIENLVVGHTYTIRETNAPTGFLPMEDMTFTVLSNEDMYITLGNNTYVDFQKVDKDTFESLQGAWFEVFSYDETGEEVIIDEFVSTSESVRIEGLVNGSTYYLREVAAPNGYYLSDEVMEFVVGQDVNVVFENEVVTTEFIKIDSHSEDRVVGALLEVFEVLEDGTENILEQFTTSQENHIIKGLVEGNTYYLREVSAPEGYYFNEECVEFVAGVDIFVTLENAPITTNIQVNKVDSNTKEAIIDNDFTFGLYADKECTEILQTVNANTSDGTATFEGLYFGTYYVKEMKAPSGYTLSQEVKEVVLNENTENIGTTIEIEFENVLTPVIDTSDSTSIVSYVVLLAVCLLSIGYFKRKRV